MPKMTMLRSVPSSGLRLTSPSTAIASMPKAAAGAGPRSAMIGTCTIRPLDMRSLRAQVETLSASTISVPSAMARLTGCQSSRWETSAVSTTRQAVSTPSTRMRADTPLRASATAA